MDVDAQDIGELVMKEHECEAQQGQVAPRAGHEGGEGAGEIRPESYTPGVWDERRSVDEQSTPDVEAAGGAVASWGKRTRKRLRDYSVEVTPPNWKRLEQFLEERRLQPGDSLLNLLERPEFAEGGRSRWRLKSFDESAMPDKTTGNLAADGRIDEWQRAWHGSSM